jgi:hypothetical protein
MDGRNLALRVQGPVPFLLSSIMTHYNFTLGRFNDAVSLRTLKISGYNQETKYINWAILVSLKVFVPYLSMYNDINESENVNSSGVGIHISETRL